ncbi:hypothetical protein [Halorarum salinum]|uniref:Uncharacterized protein n=1 Tax=Halorarum salinum TaxID=2743089 RepID=A0A7D5LBU9_9EURY|nr:hypothetical protein [Halobaculum salinum]QLG62831.1 hypothetical protein HUG12_14280 [Halobaculum salinum]
MSATSASDDPVQTVIDLLSGTAEADWPGGIKPDPIEPQWESDFRTKSNRSAPAAYVYSPEDGSREQFGAEYETVDQTETVRVVVWAPDETATNAVSSDAIAILEDYANDTRENTEWVTIRPSPVDDRRAEMLARRADQAVVAVDVELRRDDSTGT